MLEVRGLDLFYGDAQALDGVSLRVESGQIVAIVGANGAGRRASYGHIRHREAALGTILFRGRTSPAGKVSAPVTSASGRSPKDDRFFPLSRWRKIWRWVRCSSGTPKALQTLDEVYAMFPQLAERRTQLAGTMSGGEQQMLAIGRCLMGQPELIMFDEPRSGLHPPWFRRCFRPFARSIGVD